MKPSTARRTEIEQWADNSALDRCEPSPAANGREPIIADTTYKAVTANRVRDGITIYLTAAGEWSPDIADAHVADAAQLLADAQADPLSAIGPYIIDVKITNGRVRPTGLREQIRAFGPTA